MKITRTYSVSGMTCQNCVTRIQTTLSAIDGVTSIQVDLDKKQATIEMSRPLDTPELERALKKAGNYRLGAGGVATSQTKGLIQYLPLAIAFSSIIGFTVIRQLLLTNKDMIYAMHDFMGAFFVVFGGFKLLDWRGFVEAYSTYDIVAQKSRWYAFSYPLIELILGICYLSRWETVLASWVTLVIMSVSSIGVARALLSKRQIPCACLGTRFKVPMTQITLLEDVLMAIMAAGMIYLSCTKTAI